MWCANFWYYTKRPTNVYLVVDTSGSMEGSKLDRTRQSVRGVPVADSRRPRPRGHHRVWFSGIKDLCRCSPRWTTQPPTLLTRIDRMEAEGGTALIDAPMPAIAIELLGMRRQPEAINAIVVMTDGQENESFSADPERDSTPAAVDIRRRRCSSPSALARTPTRTCHRCWRSSAAASSAAPARPTSPSCTASSRPISKREGRGGHHEAAVDRTRL
jgi:hypothetical protein